MFTYKDDLKNQKLYERLAVCLGLNALCRRELLICLQLHRVLSEGIEILPSGRQCHIALFGAFGENGMLEVLRDVNGLFLIFKHFSFVLY